MNIVVFIISAFAVILWISASFPNEQKQSSRSSGNETTILLGLVLSNYEYVLVFEMKNRACDCRLIWKPYNFSACQVDSVCLLIFGMKCQSVRVVKKESIIYLSFFSVIIRTSVNFRIEKSILWELENMNVLILSACSVIFWISGIYANARSILWFFGNRDPIFLFPACPVE